MVAFYFSYNLRKILLKVGLITRPRLMVMPNEVSSMQDMQLGKFYGNIIHTLWW